MIARIIKKFASFVNGSGNNMNTESETNSDIEKMIKIVELLKNLEKAVRKRSQYFQEQVVIERGLVNTMIFSISILLGMFASMFLYLAIRGSGETIDMTKEMEFLFVILFGVTIVMFLILRYIFKGMLVFLVHTTMEGRYHQRIMEILKTQNKIRDYLQEIEAAGVDIPHDVLSPNLCSQILVYLRRQQVFDIEGGIDMMRMDNSLSSVYKVEKISLFQREEIFMRTLDFDNTDEKDWGTRILSLLRKDN